MKKLLLTFLFSLLLYGEELDIATDIIEKIAVALTGNNSKVLYVYAVAEDEREIVNHSDRLRLTQSCEKAEMVFIHQSSEIPAACDGGNKIIFATRFHTFKRDRNVIGAFYWQKGRAHIIFGRERLEQKKIVLPQQYGSYIEEM